MLISEPLPACGAPVRRAQHSRPSSSSSSTGKNPPPRANGGGHSVTLP